MFALKLCFKTFIAYICIMFFMVLDLRLIKRLVVVRQPFFMQ